MGKGRASRFLEHTASNRKRCGRAVDTTGRKSEVAAKVVLDIAWHGLLSGFPPFEPTLDVLRDDLVERGHLEHRLRLLCTAEG